MACYSTASYHLDWLGEVQRSTRATIVASTGLGLRACLLAVVTDGVPEAIGKLRASASPWACNGILSTPGESIPTDLAVVRLLCGGVAESVTGPLLAERYAWRASVRRAKSW